MTDNHSDVIVDGHDGAGKSTLVEALLKAGVGRKVIKPFGGTLGDHIAWLCRQKHYSDASTLALSALVRVESTRTRGETVIFDRHWVSMLTVLPRGLWGAWIRPKCPTIVCVATPGDTITRLLARGEEPGRWREHQMYSRRYSALAAKTGALVLDSSRLTPDAMVESSLQYIQDSWHRRLDLPAS